MNFRAKKSKKYKWIQVYLVIEFPRQYSEKCKKMKFLFYFDFLVKILRNMKKMIYGSFFVVEYLRQNSKNMNEL